MTLAHDLRKHKTPLPIKATGLEKEQIMPDYDDRRDGQELLMTALAIGSASGLVEAAEACGQGAMVASDDLPINMLGITTDQVEKHTGIIFGSPINELFVAATLPAGWAKVATNHSMHSELRDDKGRVRAEIFYKAAHYDRRADLHWVSRFKIEHTYGKGARDVFVTDGGAKIHNVGQTIAPSEDSYDDALHTDLERLRGLAKVWLDERYPDWINPLACWETAD